jgi:hypothetical protein
MRDKGLGNFNNLKYKKSRTKFRNFGRLRTNMIYRYLFILLSFYTDFCGNSILTHVM